MPFKYYYFDTYQILSKHSTSARPLLKCSVAIVRTIPPIVAISDLRISTWFCFRFITVTTPDWGTDFWRTDIWDLGLQTERGKIYLTTDHFYFALLSKKMSCSITLLYKNVFLFISNISHHWSGTLSITLVFLMK